MEEDVLRRRQQAVGAKDYTLCTACGRPISRAKSVLVRGELLHEAISEQGELCLDCARALDEGEHLSLE